LAINDLGAVVGYIDPSNGNLLPHAYVWTATNGLTDLTPGPDSDGLATGINDLGQIVGNASLNGGAWFPFLYKDGTLIDLTTLLNNSATGWTNITPKAINDLGQIAGFGSFDGQTEAFLLTPTTSASSSITTPEPSTLTLFALAIPFLLSHRYERKAKNLSQIS